MFIGKLKGKVRKFRHLNPLDIYVGGVVFGRHHSNYIPGEIVKVEGGKIWVKRALCAVPMEEKEESLFVLAN